MSAFIVPTAFVLGVVSGGLLIHQWRSGRDAAGGLRRWQKWKIVVATCLLTTVVLLASAYAFVRHRFRKTTASRATMGQAVADFRKAGGAASGGAAGKAPPAGVYSYAATGFYQITAPIVGKERRVLPPTVPAVLVADGDCWELDFRYFKQHHWTVRYCWDPGGRLRTVWRKNRNEIFSMKSASQSSCEPAVFIQPGQKPGTEWKQTCKPVKPRPEHHQAKVGITIRYVGKADLTIGGKRVATKHLRRSVKMDAGMQGASFVQDMWFAADTGLMVKFRVKGTGAGMAKFEADYTVTLRSLVPQR